MGKKQFKDLRIGDSFYIVDEHSESLDEQECRGLVLSYSTVTLHKKHSSYSFHENNLTAWKIKTGDNIILYTEELDAKEHFLEIMIKRTHELKEERTALINTINNHLAMVKEYSNEILELKLSKHE